MRPRWPLNGLRPMPAKANELLPVTPPALIAKLESMPTESGWDSYGGSPTTDAAKDVARIMLAPPCIVPTNSGGIQLEWHQGGWDIEIVIEADGTLSESWSEKRA